MAQYPEGHLNHLIEDEQKALDDFKSLAKEHGCYSEFDQKASHDDGTMLRFLRARKFVVNDALQQFEATEKWRKEQDLENWYDTISINDFEQTRLLYTQWTGRRDKLGIPLYVFDIGSLTKHKVPTDKEKLRRLFATYEHLTNFVMPLCTLTKDRPYPETPITSTCCIVDISGISIRQFWGLKNHLQDASNLATAHYPETLGRTFIVGAPSFFSTIWNWISNWFDANTVSKIFILPAMEVQPTLEKFVDLCNIPTRYGGELDWTFGQLPNLDSGVAKVLNLADGATTIPMGPIRWKNSQDGTRVEAHALGTNQGSQRDIVIGSVALGSP